MIMHGEQLQLVPLDARVLSERCGEVVAQISIIVVQSLVKAV